MVETSSSPNDAVEAAYSVLIEVSHILGQYRDDLVLIGGWVPKLALGEGGKTHLGSTDVDFALDHRHLKDKGYERIERLLLDNGYQTTDLAYRFSKVITKQGRIIMVYLDLLAGEYGGTGKGHRHQKVENLQARKARGADLAFESPIEVQVEGTLPNGAKDAVTIRVASIIPFLIMKGMALKDRKKAKDAYDVYFSIRHYPGGLDSLVKVFEHHRKNKMIREGLENIRSAFKTIDHIGPMGVLEVYQSLGAVGEAGIQRDAFEQVDAFLKRVL